MPTIRRSHGSRTAFLSLLVVVVIAGAGCGLSTTGSPEVDDEVEPGGEGTNGEVNPVGGSVQSGDKDRPKNSEVRIDEARITGSLGDGELTVHVPMQRIGADEVSGTLRLELYRLEDGRVLDSAKLSYQLADGEWSDVVGRVAIDEVLSDQAELVNYNLRISDDDPSGLRVTRSALTVLPRYEVRLDGPARITADKTVSYRVRAHDPKTFAPVSSAPVQLILSHPGTDTRVLEGATDEQGDAFFALALSDPGDYEVEARAQSQGTGAALGGLVSVEGGAARLLFTTDKPLYQPGQTVHLRALSLAKAANAPRANAKVVFEISDAKGNKIYKRAATTDAYGIAAASFRLGTVLNMGTFSARVIAEGGTTQKTFEVSRYVLPKFALNLGLDKPFYAAGETVVGKLDARYFFGKNVVDGSVAIDASTLDIGKNVFAHIVGKTNSDGTFDFSFELPSTLAGLPLERGNALVFLRASVTDAAGQLATKDAAIIVGVQGAHLVIVPESTTLVAGMDNQLQVFLNDPLGAPIADANVTLSMDGAELPTVTTDAFGQAVVNASPTNASITVSAVAQLPNGKQVREIFTFAQQQGVEHVIVRSDCAVYDVGGTVKLEILTSEANGSVYVDWLNEGQAVAQHTLLAEEGKATFEVPLDHTLLGSNRIEAYVVDAGGNVSRAGRTVFVRSDAALSVELKTDKTTYEPGQPAELTFVVKDEAGQPAVAALGVQIVDEALFSLVDAKPGLLRTYFELDDAFATPHYEIHAPPGSLSELVFEDTRVADAAANRAAQQRAQATFAALGGQMITGIHAASWPMTLQRIRELLAELREHEKQELVTKLRSVAADGTAELARRGCTRDASFCSMQGTDFYSALRSYIYAHVNIFDPWGNRYVESTQASAVLVFETRGPDELEKSEDDGELRIRFDEVGVVSGGLGGGGTGATTGGGTGGVSSGGVSTGGVSTGGSVGGTTGGSTGADAPVDDDGGDSGGEPRVRREFPETLYVNPAVITGPDGIAKVTVPLADSITSWRVSTLANTQTGKLGGNAHGLVVFQDFFADVDFPATITRGDQVSFPISLYNYLDTAQTITVSLQAADWYTPTGETSAVMELAPNQVKGLAFPVRVDDTGLHTLTVKAVGSQRSDAVERTVRVVPDGKRFAQASSDSLKPGTTAIAVSYPANAVPGSGELALHLYPACLASVVSGMESMLREPYGCFEQTTSTTWPNVLVLRYLRDTKQVTPELELKAESFISAGYQRLVTYEHPGGGFSWFGTQDAKPVLSVTAVGLMEFAEMSAIYDVDPALISRTANWLAAQQKPDGAWPGDMSELFSFHTSIVRNTAFVVASLASAGYSGPQIERGLAYLKAHYKDEAPDAYTLGIVANAFAAIAPSDATLSDVLALLVSMKKVQGTKVSWDSAGTQTTFYGSGNDATVATTAIVTHALLTAGGYVADANGALEFLSSSRDSSGNFGSTQATVWTLRTLLLAARKGTTGAVGTVTVTVDGKPFTDVNLTADQHDVTTTIDMASLATAGDHVVALNFVGSGVATYNLLSAHHLPWTAIPAEPAQPLAVSITYDRQTLAVNETVSAQLRIRNLTSDKANMILVDVGIPPGFEVMTQDLDGYLRAKKLAKYEVTQRQLILYVSELDALGSADFTYRLRATMPVKASDGGVTVYPYYQPDRKSQAASKLLEVI